jgi:putative toxin-antitoxin system antitoxin component (TIGR02293 family)
MTDIVVRGLTIATIGSKLTTDVVSREEGSIMSVASVAAILGVRKTLRGGTAERIDLMKLSQKGVDKDALLRLAKYLDLSVSQIAALLPVTLRTIQRYSRNHRFNQAVSEHILQITEVALRGASVFGRRDKFVTWMKSNSPALGNRTAASLLGSRFGAELVLDELGRIEHGVVS